MIADSLATSGLAHTLGDYTSAGLILPSLRESDSPGVIKELSHLLHQAGSVPDMLPFYNEVLNREFLVNTAMDCGIALPHARMNDLKRLCFALGRSPVPIAWGPRDGLSVRFVFLLAIPTIDAASYLYLLSGLARLARESEWLRQLEQAPSPDGMWHVLKQIKLRPRQNKPDTANLNRV